MKPTININTHESASTAKSHRFALALVIAGTLVAGAVHAQVIDTTPTWDGTAFASFGEPSEATVGQTFRTPLGFVQLNDFTFFLRTLSLVAPDRGDFAAYVMEWNPVLNQAAGSILFQSARQLPPNRTATLISFSFNTGGLLLDSSKQYVAFLSASNFFDGSPESADVGSVSANVYADGNFVFSNNGSNFGALTTSPWIDRIGQDAAFRASFGVGQTAVPEPSTYGLLGAATLLGLVAFRRRRKAAA